MTESTDINTDNVNELLGDTTNDMIEQTNISSVFLNIAIEYIIQSVNIILRSPYDRLEYVSQTISSKLKYDKEECLDHHYIAEFNELTKHNKGQGLSIYQSATLSWRLTGFNGFYNGCRNRCISILPIYMIHNITTISANLSLYAFQILSGEMYNYPLISYTGIISAQLLKIWSNSFLVYPFEVIQTHRISNLSNKSDDNYMATTSQLLYYLYKSNKLSQLWKGYSLSILSSLTGNIIFFTLKNSFQMIFSVFVQILQANGLMDVDNAGFSLFLLELCITLLLMNVTAYIIHPIEILKKHVQLEIFHAKSCLNSHISYIKCIYYYYFDYDKICNNKPISDVKDTSLVNQYAQYVSSINMKAGLSMHLIRTSFSFFISVFQHLITPIPETE